MSAHRASPEQVGQWWQQYHNDRSEEARTKLISHYWPKVRMLALRLAAKMPGQVDVEDLVSMGAVGLIEAVRSFDPRRNIKFETFAAYRIQGAILDGVRDMDWVPRLTRQRQRLTEEAVRTLEAALGRQPDEGELAEALKMDARQLRLLLNDRVVRLVPLSTNDGDESDPNGRELPPDPRSPDPANDAACTEVRHVIARGLDRTERLVVVLYYAEELTLKEIGHTLGVSEGRVSQILAEVRERLGRRLNTAIAKRIA